MNDSKVSHIQSPRPNDLFSSRNDLAESGFYWRWYNHSDKETKLMFVKRDVNVVGW